MFSRGWQSIGTNVEMVCLLSDPRMNAEMSLVMKKNEEREALRGVIQQWNANRLDLFELSEPNDVSLW